MCGIFGTLSTQTIELSVFTELAQLNTVRGNLGFGWVGIGAAETVNRYAEPFAEQLDHARGEIDRAKGLLGHIRAPTGRRSNNLAEIHPFETERFLLAHNGLLLNHHQFPDWRLNRAIDVDSQIILGGIQAHVDQNLRVTQAICQTATKLDGQQACWLWDRQTEALYLWRVMSPIYLKIDSNSVTFSSVKFDGGKPLVEGFVYRIVRRLFEIDMDKVGHFHFDTPYLS